MSSELILKSICDDGPDYEGLLASIGILKPLLDCDSNGKIKEGPGIDILKKLFLSGNNGCDPNIWFDLDECCHHKDKEECDCIVFFSCVDERYIHYYDKKCKIVCKAWKPQITDCIERAIDKVIEKFPHYPTQICTFKEIVNGFLLFIATGLKEDCLDYQELHVVLIALCDVLKQRIYLDKLLHKALVTK
jgi:hypothetical protein